MVIDPNLGSLLATPNLLGSSSVLLYLSARRGLDRLLDEVNQVRRAEFS